MRRDSGNQTTLAGQAFSTWDDLPIMPIDDSALHFFAAKPKNLQKRA
jgi:hypothetical protein